MAEIVGTITNLSDFLSKTQVCLSVKPNDPQQQIICLEADRKYSIPAFQREVRWDDNNLKMLLYDLSRSSKFLGNIILTIKSDHTCEIIDGQQRTTVLTPNVEFSFDVAITTKNKNGNYMRLIHNKNVYALGLDQYTWNEVPNSHQVKDRADKLKRAGLWQKVRDRYLEKKNMYLFRQDHNHPSFVVYVEAVNEVYSRYFNRGGGYSVQSIF